MVISSVIERCRHQTQLKTTKNNETFEQRSLVYSHFTFWASPQHILLHFPINLLHFPIKFASFPQKNASFPQQFAAFPQQNASFPQPLGVFPYAMLCHFANILKPNFTKYYSGQTHYYFFDPGEKLCNIKYICVKYLTITTVLKMHKFCHSGAKPFSKGKDVSKTNYTR